MQQRSTTWANVGNIGPLTFRLSGSFKVIRTNMNRSATYDFLLEIHRNHAPISYRDRDKRRFVWKMQINLLRLCLTPPLRVLLQNFVTLVRLQKTRMVALPDGENDMQGPTFVQTKYTRRTDGRTDRQAISRSRVTIPSCQSMPTGDKTSERIKKSSLE